MDALLMAYRFIPDINTSRRLSSPEEITAMEPDKKPTENLLEARTKAIPVAKKDALYLVSMFIYSV